MALLLLGSFGSPVLQSQRNEPLARSTDASMEVLRAAASSPNVRDAGSAADLLDPEEDDDVDRKKAGGVAAWTPRTEQRDSDRLLAFTILFSLFCCWCFLFSCLCFLFFFFLFFYSCRSVFGRVVGGDNDAGVYAESYKNATWIYIGDSEEMHVWQKPESKADEKDEKSAEEEHSPGNGRRSSDESTNSEKDFKRKYQAITHRMVHRKSSVEMYKRLASKSFEGTQDYNPYLLQDRLEEILRLILDVRRKEIWALRVRGIEDKECDKTVVVRRQSGEFGFRIHGSRPVVVSAIEPDTPAETSGLEVGDIVIAVNGVNVLDASHSEVVKIAHAGSDTLELEVARTCNVLTPVLREPGAGSALYSGFLWKEGGAPSSASGRKWVRRWFCLKRDNCLYYYKTDAESQPLGALMLTGYGVQRSPDSGHAHSFLLAAAGAGSGGGATQLHLAADSDEGATRWLAVISHSIERNAQVDEWLELSRRNMRLAPSAVHQPDCFGYLMQLGHRWKTWQRRYCVLKDACLYFYQDCGADSALGMVCLHGYRVQNSTAGGKRFAFEILPPEPRQRHYYLHTDSEMDKKRWLAALEYSIDRWIKVG